ncbi:polysaccharide biosynthesis protein [Marinicella gelatinilytica]|uniref:polysaccharide biosynthesis protein n=1 Tax=Marinicella gelatinilytica TaxID=2996017 RepID=UPI002260B0F2|nr:nucleoside-diphosphate sugar epimerase/dehydratase [Marinicella gelatinilytica]MCX7543928.1 nucleoside-diphosphate sugar epimerase/dehydratase [Marinicella gelatinilytica]
MINRMVHLRLAVITHDLLMVWLAWVASFYIRYSIWPMSPTVELWSLEIALVLLVQGLVSFYFDMYRGLWRFASVPDLMNLLKSALVGTLAIAGLFFLMNRLSGMPRSVIVMYPILLVLFWGVPRISYRLWKDKYFNLSSDSIPRVILVGAGNIADLFIRNAVTNRSCHVMSIVDDDVKYQGTQLRGIKIQRGVERLPDLVAQYDVDLVVITKQNPDANLIRTVVDALADGDCQIRIAPDPDDYDSNLANVNDLQPITVEDLLGREKVELDWQKVAQFVRNKSVMVTGGGGSIGAELCRQLTRFGVSQLTIVDHSEYNLYAIDNELAGGPTLIRSHLGDITNQAQLFYLFKEVKPDVVFHAAAYKHVPLLENHLCEAYLNNVIGTRIVADCCDQFNVSKMVLISTDKAVNPHSVMGATKRLSEKYCQYLNTISKTDYVTVRFGNVLGSAGSVVPLFKKQIEQGGPVTVTDARMERYFMTIEEACQLILQGLVVDHDDGILVLDMGHPIKIKSLAKRMIALTGQSRKIQIEYTGLRQGEKLFEELHYANEELTATEVDKINLAKHNSIPTAQLIKQIEQGRTAAVNYQHRDLKVLLQKMIKEFKGNQLNVITSGQQSSGKNN